MLNGGRLDADHHAAIAVSRSTRGQYICREKGTGHNLGPLLEMIGTLQRECHIQHGAGLFCSVGFQQ